MKVCPVCNESFGDELRFCDLDGTRLKRQPGSEHSGSSQGRVWSLLGVGVLLGALVIAVLSIIFTPRPNAAPTLASSSPAPSSVQSVPGSQSAAETQPASTTEQPQIIVEETAPPVAKKKEKPQDNLDSNANLPPLTPKEVVQGDSVKDAANTEEPGADAATAPKKVEPAPVIKPASDTRDSEISPKAAATSTEAKKDKKAANAKASDKESDAKKKDDEKDKKKGGFFRVFKKIFGKG
jgi:hypothetical protein